MAKLTKAELEAKIAEMDAEGHEDVSVPKASTYVNRLSKKQQAFVDSLDEEGQAIVVPQLHAKNKKNWAKRGEMLDRWQETREVFDLKMGDLGTIGISGLGQRFGLNLYPDQFETLMSHVDEIRSFIKVNSVELEARKARRTETLKARKAAKVAAKNAVLKKAGFR